MFKRKSRRARFAALMAVGGLIIAACGDSDSGTDHAGGPGVPVGSDGQAYSEALAGESIQLEWASLIPSEQEAYQPAADYISDLSGDNITFDLDFGYAKVPLPDVVDALAMGRADMGMYIPAYEPSKWPVTGAMTDMMMNTHPTPVGRLAAVAAQTEFAFGTDALYDEAERNGIVPMFPIYSVVADLMVACSDGPAPTSLADFPGKQIQVSSEAASGIIREAGATPISMPGLEVYEALQRGVVDCSMQSLSAADAHGYEDITEVWVFGSGPGAGTPTTAAGWGFSKRTWEGLPLAAQQVIWDAQPKILGDLLTSIMLHAGQLMERADQAGVEVAYLDPDANARLVEFGEQYAQNAANRLDEQGLDGQAMLSRYNDLYEKWWGILTGELGFDPDLQWTDADQAGDPTVFDIPGYVGRLNSEVLASGRPE